MLVQLFSSTEAETTSGDIHIHLVISDTKRYSEFIILKDYLLNNKEEARNYSNLKRKIIEDGVVDRKQYKAVKIEYVTGLITRAKEWNNSKDAKERVDETFEKYDIDTRLNLHNIDIL